MNNPFARASTSPFSFASSDSQKCFFSEDPVRRPVSINGFPSGTGFRYSTSICRVMASTPNCRFALLIASSSRVATIPPCAWPGGPSNRRGSRARHTIVCASSTKNFSRSPLRFVCPHPKHRFSAPCDNGSSFGIFTDHPALTQILRDPRFRPSQLHPRAFPPRDPAPAELPQLPQPLRPRPRYACLHKSRASPT
jgi:hypothetical protein